MIDEVTGLRAKIDELTAENLALKTELKLARGEVKNVLHNTEIAKLKAERLRDEYMERLKEPPEQAWADEIERAKASADYWRKLYDELLDANQKARTVLERRHKYELKEVG